MLANSLKKSSMEAKEAWKLIILDTVWWVRQRNSLDFLFQGTNSVKGWHGRQVWNIFFSSTSQLTSMFASQMAQLGFFRPPLPQTGSELTSAKLHLFWGGFTQEAFTDWATVAPKRLKYFFTFLGDTRPLKHYRVWFHLTIFDPRGEKTFELSWEWTQILFLPLARKEPVFFYCTICFWATITWIGGTIFKKSRQRTRNLFYQLAKSSTRWVWVPLSSLCLLL